MPAIDLKNTITPEPVRSDGISFRRAQDADHPIVAHNFLLMWRDMGVEEIISDDCEAQALSFFKSARETLAVQPFVAFDPSGEIVGSAVAQLYEGFYPPIFNPKKHREGWIWAVYVKPEFRRRKIADNLVRLCCAYLKEVGCTTALLNASHEGRHVYEKIGFKSWDMMELELE
ncbi:hypothetical protein HDU93_002046 [Gonapodya sp. JEL0774]|nr:hypothetical protein HDU93_002046 [Gonapodya sp. JEL0774]